MDKLLLYAGQQMPLWVVWWLLGGVAILLVVFVVTKRLLLVWIAALIGLWSLRQLLDGGALNVYVYWILAGGVVGIVLLQSVQWFRGIVIKKRQADLALTERCRDYWQVLYNGQRYRVRNVTTGEALPPLVKVIRTEGGVADVEY